MDFNKFSAYSIVSSVGSKSNNDMQKILGLIEDFEKIKSIEKAKEYLRDKYKIKDSINNFSLGSNSYMNVKENDRKFAVNIFYEKDGEKECAIYSFKK